MKSDSSHTHNHIGLQRKKEHSAGQMMNAHNGIRSFSKEKGKRLIKRGLTKDTKEGILKQGVDPLDINHHVQLYDMSKCTHIESNNMHICALL